MNHLHAKRQECDRQLTSSDLEKGAIEHWVLVFGLHYWVSRSTWWSWLETFDLTKFDNCFPTNICFINQNNTNNTNTFLSVWEIWSYSQQQVGLAWHKHWKQMETFSLTLSLVNKIYLPAYQLDNSYKPVWKKQQFAINLGHNHPI